MSKRTILQNNPLFREVSPVAVPPMEEPPQEPQKPIMRKIKPAKQEEYRHASFIMKESAYKFVRDYAYTMRLPIKDAISNIVEYFETAYKTFGNSLIEDPNYKK